MELLVCMSIAGSIPVVICLLLYIIQRGNYNYILGRRLLLTGVFFYLVPVQLVKYLLPKDALPETMLIGKKADSYLSGSLAFWSEKQGEYIWIPQWFNLFARIWLTGIIIFAIYEIVKSQFSRDVAFAGSQWERHVVVSLKRLLAPYSY